MEAMQAAIRDAMQAGAIGISFDRNPRHVDMNGKLLPGNVSSDDEILTLASVLKDLGTGAIEVGDPMYKELDDRFCSRVSEASGRPVAYLSIVQSELAPDLWRQHLEHRAANNVGGVRAYPLINPRPGLRYFQMDSAEFFNFMPTWRSIMTSPSTERLERFADKALRKTLSDEVLGGTMAVALGFSGRWDLMVIAKPALEKNAYLAGKSIAEMAEEQGKEPVDAFLDLTVEEGLKTWFARNEQNNDDDAMAEILSSDHTMIGLSDAGAHVVREGGYGIYVHFLSHWVRDKKVMALEEGIRRITSHQADFFGLADRGRLQQGLAADVVVFDLANLALDPTEETHDLPGGSMRLKQVASGIPYTIVNGEVLIENGEHTGALPGRVLRGSAYTGA